MPIKKDENHAILVRIDWNENKWEKPSSNLDQAKNFGFVKDQGISHTSFNFANDLYNSENDGLWYGLIPAFASKTPDADKIRNLKVVFIISKKELKEYIVGLYAFPKIGNAIRTNKIPHFENFDWINIGAHPENILRFENYLDIETMNKKRFLGSQEISTQGWNYLNQSQVGYVFDSIQEINLDNNKLKKIKYNYLKSNI
jgi:hypothetical protein